MQTFPFIIMSKTLLIKGQVGLTKSQNSIVTSNNNKEEMSNSNTCLICAVSFTENVM